MHRNENRYPPGVIFTDLTPKMQIGKDKTDPRYEKAFLLPQAESDKEFSRNTTVWD